MKKWSIIAQILHNADAKHFMKHLAQLNHLIQQILLHGFRNQHPIQNFKDVGLCAITV